MKLRFTDKKDEGNGTWSFCFEPVASVSWLAGQSIRLELPRKTYGTGERRFTIASAPSEGRLQITTRLSDSSFKQSLANLKPGDEVQGHNIEGDFVWGDEDGPRLFIAGGIGITPFRAMLAQAIKEQKRLNATLVYVTSDVPPLFQAELNAWHSADPSLHVHYLPGKGLALDNRSSMAAHWLQNLIYISGPKGMVDDIYTALIKHGAAKQQIKTDQFTGYA
ncbi:MAG: FAD-dependent oxidoreductase [Candidatus Saccharimonadales bacterium]